MAALPASIGRYRPVALLGTGAMGTVYKAHDPLIDRMVAIKVVRAEALDTEGRATFLERFRQEVQAAGRCSHPAIVGVYDFVGDAGDPSIVMELVEGNTLQHILRDPAARAAVPTVPILLQVLDGLGAAHAQGVIHRDIKPANIIVTPAGQAKIADFGIARLNEAVMTHSGAMLGTPQYMAPEQVSDDAVDRRADLFAVGAILYEILAGRPPFAGRTIAQTIQRLGGPESADMTAIARDPQCIPVLQRALAKDRSQRFQTAAEFAAALQSAADPAQATVVPMPRRAPGRVWDPALLQRVERQLAVYVGPMARRTVAQAALDAGSAEELYATVARGLSNAADRSAFLRALGGARVEPSLTIAGRTDPLMTGLDRGQTGATHTGSGHPLAPSAGIPAEAITVAQTVLAFFVGPIARVMARDAAGKATSGRDFIERLCGQVTKPDEQAALRRRLRAEVEPRLR
jgi:eukaryotic-like serine/threonine-protein kinase